MKFRISLIVVLATYFVGCATTGTFRATNITNVQLSTKNYKVLMKNAYGEAQAGYLFGASFSSGQQANTIALIRVSGTGMLYREAMNDLWEKFEKQHGPVEEKNLALINVSYDADALNVLGIYTQPKISISADIIEFIE